MQLLPQLQDSAYQLLGILFATKRKIRQKLCIKILINKKLHILFIT